MLKKTELFIFSAVLFLTLFINSNEKSFAITRTVPQQYSTIQAAIDASSNGDVIVVSPGTYAGFEVSKQITITAASYDQSDPSQNNVIITGSVTASGDFPWNEGPVIRGIKTSTVVIAKSALTLEYSHVTNGRDNVSFEGGGGIIRGNFIDGGGDDGIDMDKVNKHTLIENNYVYNNTQEGIEIRLQDTIVPETAVYTIRNNRFESNGWRGDGDGIQIIDYYTDTNRKFVIERNLFLNNKMAGIGFQCCQNTKEEFQAAPVKEEVKVFNNIFIGNNHGVSGGANIFILNNIFQGHVLGIKNSVENSIAAHNLFWNNTENYAGSNVDLNTMVVQDPLFDANYNLQEGSPAIDYGTANYVHNGITVLEYSPESYQGNNPDLGAYESSFTRVTPVPSPTPTDTPTLTPSPTIDPNEPTPTATDTPAPSPTPTETPTPTPPIELLQNGGFEMDSVSNGSPDFWKINSKFLKESSVYYSGSYSGCYLSATNADYNIDQIISNILPNTSYQFRGLSNIPATSDRFIYRIQLKWRDSSGTIFKTDNLKIYTAATSGWDETLATTVSPANAASVIIRMNMQSVKGPVYVDDFSFTQP